MHRRQFLTWTGAYIALAALPIKAWSAVWNTPAFQSSKLDEAMHLLGVAKPMPSDKIVMTAPDKAENGAVVQVQVRSHLANTQSIAILVEKNPTALIAQFDFVSGVVPDVITRIKMAETSDVTAVIQADGQYFFSKKLVEVMENGCG